MKMILLLWALLTALETHAEQYWIAFTGGNNNDSYLLKIDHLGNVLAGPSRILEGKRSLGAVTISHRSRNILNLWTSRNYGDVNRATIDKKSLKLLNLYKTHIDAEAQAALQVTQKQQDNFLIYHTDGGTKLKSVKLTSGGAATSQRSILLQSTTAISYKPLRVSADGRVLIYSNFRNLLMQRLNLAGKPKGSPGVYRFLGNHYFNGFSDADATSILPQGKRIVTYISSRESVHDEENDRLYTLLIDAVTLKPVEKPVLLHWSTESGDQTGNGLNSVSIDPSGRFLLFVEHDDHPVGTLVFQPLDTTGQATGKTKVLLRKRFLWRIDLLKDLN